ncbi:MAG: S41 family peptidase [Candidatus Gracilibacteria bacterium]|jgi:carboxyl-terminal processing protease
MQKNILKKLVAILIASSIFSLNTFTTAFAFYSDVSETNTYYKEIQELYDAKRLPEYKENKLNPNEKLKTVDFYELLFTYASAPLSTNINLPFTNTDNKASYAKYLQTAIDFGLVQADSKTFDLNQTITKYQALSTMFKTLGIGVNYFFDQSKFTFTDLNKTSDTAAIAMKALELGIKETDTPDKFKKTKRITKAEAIEYLYKIYKYSPTSTFTIQVTPVQTNQSNYTKTEKELLNNASFAKLLDIWKELKTDYYYKDQIDDTELINGAITGMVERANDIYTVYQEPVEAGELLESLSTQEYEGVGMTLELIDNNATIISPFNGSPADKAGIKANDIIIEVDGASMIGKTLEEVTAKIKGKAGTTVKIKVLRDKKEKTFSVKREKISYKSVMSKTLTKDKKTIGYIQINIFGAETYNDFVAQASDLIDQKVSGFIIDLRNNPGGYMDTAIQLISLFTKEKKTAVELKFSDGSIEKYKTDGNGLLAGYKTVVLINNGSASASEILAGALKDYNLAKLVGDKSFGKGTVQQLNTYTDGSLFKYTISEWLTPKGININKMGIAPNISVTDATKQLDKALEQF